MLHFANPIMKHDTIIRLWCQMLSQHRVSFKTVGDFASRCSQKGRTALLRNTGGSRADVKAYGLWANGMWTVEIQRTLDTGANAIKDGDKVDQVFVSLVIIESR
jgi:hypothetical protein